MLVYYDFETTGLNQFHDNITEYCFLKEKSNTSIISLVNPEKELSEIVRRITGITQEMVNSAQPLQEHIFTIIEFLALPNEFTYLVAHNGDNYDFIILREQLKKYGYNINTLHFRSIDTLLLAKKMYPHIKKYSLVSLCTQFGINIMEAHRADADTEMVKNLFHYMVNDLVNILSINKETLLHNPEYVYNYINGI
jgi:DNA polymerase III alpha subunit (gram-positive type)|uniref:Exonuclease domain-containing protein n=1 Tax=viral metagenome TaxID=1070528 RepID=A0A6C0J6I5_9ZZZZ|tara:strand:- start:84 stop:668 length:585 start_codon:yes stop_codon:yes gene_type:complete